MKIRTKTSDDGTLRAEHRVVLITGILGQLGQYLAFFLLSTGYCHAVIGLGLGSDRANLTSNILLPQLRKFIKSGEDVSSGGLFLFTGDMTDAKSLVALLLRFPQIGVIYNLAGISNPQVAERNPKLTMAVNFTGVVNLCGAVRLVQKHYSDFNPKIIHASTIAIYKGHELELNQPNPTFSETWEQVGAYRKSKGRADAYIRAMCETSQPLRAFNVLISNCASPLQLDGFVVTDLTGGVARFKSGEAGGPFLIRNLNATIDLCHAMDTARALYLIANQELRHPTRSYNVLVASGQKISVWNILQWACQEAYGPEVEVTTEVNGEETIVWLNGERLAVSPVILKEPDLTESCLIPTVLEGMEWAQEFTPKQTVADVMQSRLSQEAELVEV